jgi:hypothetical protein
VYSVVGVALVPLSFMAIRIADTLIPPIVLTSDGNRMTGPMWGTFAVGVVAFCALAVWMLQLETAGKLRAARGWCCDDEAPAGELDTDTVDGDARPAGSVGAHV